MSEGTTALPQDGASEGREIAPAGQLALEINERAPQKFVRSKPTANSPQGLKRWTSFADRSGDFWSSLPSSTRIFALISLLDAVLVVVYAFWQFRWVREHIFKIEDEVSDGNCRVCAEHQHVVLSMLVTALFFLILVWDSISHENDFELLASMVLSAIVTGRVVFFLFTSPSVRTYAQIMGLCLALFFETITVILAYTTYKKFGWRVYSKLACDLRLKNAEERRNLYFRFHRFRTFVKLDLQFLVILMVTGVTMAVMLKEDHMENAVEFTSSSNMILLISNISGAVMGIAWLGLAFLAVHKEKMAIVTFLEFTCPVTFMLPILTIVTVYVSSDSKAWEGKESLLVATALFITTRIAVWVNVRSLTREVKQMRREGEWSINDKLKQDDTNPDLYPMLKGAWLLKPSPRSPNKKRFFQLSQDKTTLRWAWNKYVILYYVDKLIDDDEKLTITMVFSMEPDLVLGFRQTSEYEAWKRGLALLITMLMVPDPGTDMDSRVNRPGRSMLDFNYEAQSTNMLQKLLASLGIATNRGNSELKKKKPKHRGNRPNPLETSISGSIGLTPGDSNITPSRETGAQYGGELVTVAPGHFKVVMPDHLVSGRQTSSTRINNMLDKENSLSGQYLRDSGPYRDTSADSSVLTPTPQGASVIHGIGLQMPIEIIDHDDLEFGKFLGAGAEGAVWAAWYLETPVAIKKTDSMNELEIIVSAAQHDNIVGFRGIAKNGSSTFLVMEYCPRGTLDVMLHHTRMTRWDLTKVLQMVRGIARGMLHLHTRKPPILHRDLKPGNIFIGHGLVLKIGDFGMSRHVENESDTQNTNKNPIRRQFTSGVIGTPSYSAPELTDERLQSHEYNQSTMLKADVYSFGVCLWEIVERERPFEGMTYYEIATQWLSNPEEMKLPPLTVPKDASAADTLILNACQDLVMQCTSMNAERRPDFKTILKRFKAVHNELKAEGIAAV